MKNNKIVHLFLMDRFVYPYIETIKNKISESSHIYFLLGMKENQQCLKGVSDFNVLQRGNRFYFIKLCSLILSLNNADKIIIHGLFSKLYIMLIFLMPWVRSRCHWVIWGGDLYAHNGNHGVIGKIKEFFKHKIIKDFGHLVTYIDEDVELARAWYGAAGSYEFCLSYPSNLYFEVALDTSRIVTCDKLNVLVGNSADPSNNHMDIFDKLNSLSDSFNIYCPLTYGDDKYRSEIIKAGSNIFGERFHPLTESMEFEKYNTFLSTMDVAIFNHKRQQAMGNTIRLLGLGKKIYIRSDVAQWRFLKELGVSVFDTEKVDLEPMSADLIKRNKTITSEFFSEEKFIDQLNNIFNK